MRYILLKNKMVTTHCCAVAGSQGGVLTPCMAGGSRMAIDRPSHPYNAGTEHVPGVEWMDTLPRLSASSFRVFSATD